MKQGDFLHKLKWKDRGRKSVKEEIRQKFCELLGRERVLFEEPMSRHTTFRIGGPAEVFLIPESYGQIQKILKLCREDEG